MEGRATKETACADARENEARQGQAMHARLERYSVGGSRLERQRLLALRPCREAAAISIYEHHRNPATRLSPPPSARGYGRGRQGAVTVPKNSTLPNMNHESEDQTRLRRAAAAIATCMEREKEARKALASAEADTKRARERHSELFQAVETREVARRKADYRHCTN